ncbi:hypothetical protein GGR51DRAFT_498548 [Nemania sp. FL0031]|nr:hypothetical protein GGR51DRAFT_498548 [Nemania sp. FL0031]
MDNSRVQDLERQLKELEAVLKKSKAELRQAQAQIRHTTLDEYIEACHNLVYAKLTIEPNIAIWTTGSIPQPYAKLFPRRLMPWTDFHDQQSEMLSYVYQHFEYKKRLFDSLNYLETVGNKVLDTPIAGERMIELFLHRCVEDPVRRIIYQLSRSRRFQRKLKIGNGIVFENHIKALDDPSYRVANRGPQKQPAQVEGRPKTPDPVNDPPRLSPDQICVFRYEENGTEKRTIVTISEYKPPQKLSLPQLRAGLKETDMMSVVTNNKIPNDEEAKFNHCATQLVASAVTQTFDHMIKSGLTYGLLTTGEAIVFLKIDWSDPQTVYYHLAEPAEEVSSHGNFRSCSAVSQYLGFHLLALRDYSHRTQDVRKQAISELSTWSTDFRKVASEIPKERRTPPQTSSSYKPRNYKEVDRTVPRRSRHLNPDVEHDSDSSIRGSEEVDDEEDGNPRPPNTPSPSERQPVRRSARLAERHSGSSGSRSTAARDPTSERRGQGSNRSEFEGKPHQTLEYCTQKCVIGLAKGDVLDPNCPNLRLHQHRGNQSNIINTDSGHPISHSEFLRLLSHQLKCTLDYGITSLDVTGARGALFKVTLLAYGYTFIGKGTIQAFVPELEHEARVYKRLGDLQGVYVPVFLGAIDLRSLDTTYYYDFNVDIVHLCFLSWGGLGLRDVQGLDRASLQPMALEAMREIHQQGVIHKDARYENILFNPQTGRIMLIDFERSQIVDISRPILAPLQSNKRRRVQDSKGQTGLVGGSDVSDLPPQVRDDFLADLNGVKLAC